MRNCFEAGRWVRQAALAAAFLWAVLSPPSALAKERIWTSATGSQIEATYVARVGQQHWLLEKSGRILKLTLDKFSPTDAKLLDATPVSIDEWLSNGRVIAVTTKDEAVAETLEALIATRIPAFSVTQLGLEEALGQLTAAIEQHDPKHRRVEFHLDPDFATRPASVSTRNLTAVRVLNFVFNGQPGPVFATISAGRITLSSKPALPASHGSDPGMARTTFLHVAACSSTPCFLGA